ncbi:hypothetical protein ACFPZ0_10335 [Streptomonospora nanhaiensis]|uniref:hypothetical protein n=1 Tax=Streptomonospora nanhaiensis TaxID=1323731 RepID=UPI001C99C4BD|nr:hypothetical protein [Streptomonospora nanhaiensis]MBX9389816.1 hypothetical protein [Streptomonospora nanhaiensis]
MPPTLRDLNSNSSDADLRTVYESGATGIEIADQIGSAPNSVYRRIRKAGGTVRKRFHVAQQPSAHQASERGPRLDPERVRRMVEDEGMSAQAVARQFKCRLVAVTQAMDAARIPRESRKRPTDINVNYFPDVPPLPETLAGLFDPPSRPEAASPPKRKEGLQAQKAQRESSPDTTPPEAAPNPPGQDHPSGSEEQAADVQVLRVDILPGGSAGRFELHRDDLLRRMISSHGAEVVVRAIPADASAFDVASAVAGNPTPIDSYEVTIHTRRIH